MFHVATLTILSIVSGVGIIGNMLIIGSICLYKSMRVRGHAFVVNLAIADLIIVAYIMPVGLATSQFLKNPFSDAMCQINAFLIMTSCGVSTQTLMLVALERYFHICKMHIYRKAFTPKLIGLYIGIVWLYTAAWTCQGWTGWTQYIYGRHIYLCVFAGPVSISYDVCLAFFGMLLPMIVLAVCYYKIFRKVVQSRRTINAHRKKTEDSRSETVIGGASSRLHRPEVEKQAAREYRLVVTLFTIVIIFCFCWAPASIVLVCSGVWADMPKDTSSSSDQSRSGPKRTNSSGSPTCLSDTSASRSGASTATTDVTSTDSTQNLSPGPSGHASPNIQPIHYEEEPVSGRPIMRQKGTHATNHDQSAAEVDNLSIVDVGGNQVSPVMMRDRFLCSTGGTPSQTESQSSLICHSLASEATTGNDGYIHAVVHPNDCENSSQLSTQKVKGAHPPPTATKPRPLSGQQAATRKKGNTSSQEEVSMTNVLLVTKM